MKTTDKKKRSDIEKDMALGKRASEGDVAARDELIMTHLPLVASLVALFMQPGLEWDDLYQEGCLGLIQAVDKFDYKRRVSLNTYATYWIKKRLKKAAFSQNKKIPLYPKEALFYNVCRYRSAYDRLYMRTESKPSDAEIAAETGQTLEETQFISDHLYQVVSLQDIVSNSFLEGGTTLEEILIPPSNQYLSAEELAFRRMASFDQREWGVTLTKREHLVLSLHLGFTPSGRPETFAAISAKTGWGLETVRQYYLTALYKIKAKCLAAQQEGPGPPGDQTDSS